jgi:hypothetical protein
LISIALANRLLLLPGALSATVAIGKAGRTDIDVLQNECTIALQPQQNGTRQEAE